MVERLPFCIAASALALLAYDVPRYNSSFGLATSAGVSNKASEYVPQTQVGMNLGSPSYWSSEWAFDDIIQSTGTLLVGAGWTPLNGQVPVDPAGHPFNVPAGTMLHVMVQSGSPRLPIGSFRCHISPGWDVRVFGDWTKDGTGTDFRMVVTKPVSVTGIALTLTSRSARAALTELSCRADAPSRQARIFNPAFLDDNHRFGVIRFMDWMRTNNAPTRDWSKRPTPASFSQAGEQGVALEHMVALSNRLGADPWFTLPFNADRHYYESFAKYVRDHLAPGRKTYVELSNEVWNTMFVQGRESQRLGRVRYPGLAASQAGDFYYADRVRELMAIWSDVFRGQETRLVRVAASQAVNPARAEALLEHNNTWRSVDALATAAYFGKSIENIDPEGGSRVGAVFANGPKMVEEAIAYDRTAKRIAFMHNLRFISYEGGPSFQSYRGDLRHDALAVNQDERIHDMYALFLRRWQHDIGDLLMVFDSVSTPGPGGSFGHRTYTGQPLIDAPKARAVDEFMRQQQALLRNH